MLNPNDERLDYGDILCVPPGCKLSFAVGTTYSLDLDALVGASVSLALQEDTDSTLKNNPVCLLRTLMELKEKAVIFCESGQIYSPNHITPLYMLFENMVYAITTNKHDGITKYPSFHPKFWLIRYTDDDKNIFYRIIVLSRNLTFDRSWDISFAMDGEVTQTKTLKNKPVQDFLNYLTEYLNDDSSKLKKKQIKKIIKELSFVDFNLNSDVFSDFEFLPTGIKDSDNKEYSISSKGFKPLFSDKYDELLIISPFLSSSVIKDFNNRAVSRYKDNYKLFTRASSLSKIKKSDCSKFKLYVLKDEYVDGESAFSDDDNSDVKKQDIHAKIYMVRKGDIPYLYLGSLNASHNATKGNVEFMVRLKSKSNYLNIDKLSNDLFCDEYGTLKCPFEETEISDDLVDDEDEIQNSLDYLMKNIVRFNSFAVVKENGLYYDLEVNFEELKIESGYIVKISPMFSKATKDWSEHVLFEKLSLSELSSFYKIKIYFGENAIERIITIPTEGIPEDRDKKIISRVIDSRTNFYNYITYLLGDNSAISSMEINESLEAVYESKSNSNSQRAHEFPMLYEKMLRIAHDDPSRFKEIDYMIDALKDSNAVPLEFENLYNTFKKVVKKHWKD